MSQRRPDYDELHERERQARAQQADRISHDEEAEEDK